MGKKVNFPIDFVISWVDQSDSKWKKKFNKYASQSHDENEELRFRDYGTLRFVFRSIEKYAPWVRKIFFVTDEQCPCWLNANNSKIVLIDHKDYIPKKYLPTFDSNVIELNYYRIDDLSEHFVCFNDDMLINKPVVPEDFFDCDGNPKDTLAMNAIMPNSIFDHTHVNNMMLVNHIFPNKKQILKSLSGKIFNFKNKKWNIISLLMAPWPKFTRFFDPHIPLSFKKSSLIKILGKYPFILERTSDTKFRSESDFSIWAIRYVQMLSGEFATRDSCFGQYYDLKDWKSCYEDIMKSKHALICINDASFKSDWEFQFVGEKIHQALNNKFENISEFEVKDRLDG